MSVYVVVVLSARADDGSFYIRHIEFSPVVVAVQNGRPAKPGEPLVVHYTRNPTAEALRFKEDARTKNIVTVTARLCIIDYRNGTPHPPALTTI